MGNRNFGLLTFQLYLPVVAAVCYTVLKNRRTILWQKKHDRKNAVRSGDDVTCPNCGSHNVRCIPYPKVEFGIWFVLWLIVAFGGYMISVFITIVGIIFWSIALVIRLKQNKLAKQFVRMQCITCGTEFDVARSELMKGGSGK